MARLEEVLLGRHPAVLVAHSLGCILTAAWAAHSRNTHRVVGALLVAPGDSERDDLGPQLPSWAPIVRQRLPFLHPVRQHQRPVLQPHQGTRTGRRQGQPLAGLRRAGPPQRRVRPGRLARGPGAAQRTDSESLTNMVTKTQRPGPRTRSPAGPVADNATAAPATTDGLPTTLTLDQLVPGVYQPRTRMDEGAVRAGRVHQGPGIMQPILVRQLADGEHAGKYEIIAGERRFRASRLAGLDSVPVLVRDVPNEAAAAMALIENIQREDLNPLEEAWCFAAPDQRVWTHSRAGRPAVGRSRSAASNLLRLLNLADPVQTMLMAGDIDMGHARAAGAGARQPGHSGPPDRGQKTVGARDRKPGQEAGRRVQPGAAETQKRSRATSAASKKSWPTC